MATAPESILHYQDLHHSPLVRVSDYGCRACRGAPGDEEFSGADHIVLMRHGVFRKHLGRRSVTADVNQAVFFAAGSSYRVSHPADGGDRGTILAVAPRVLRDIVRELDPAAAGRPGSPFPFGSGPCEPRVFWQHRELVQRLEAAAAGMAPPLEPLWADVTALQLAADVLSAAFARYGLPRKSRRLHTGADHAERVEAVKAFLAARLDARVTLDEVAGAVYWSPYHLARIFQQHTGVPVHRYLTQLRLRAALERLAAGAQDLTALALDLGFASHSHFADTFRREFGHTPSQVRAASAGVHPAGGRDRRRKKARSWK